MFATALLSLTAFAQLDQLAETLRRANDKSSYEDGAYDAAKQLAGMRSEEAMELRLELFDEKMDTYRGVYLRDWFYSGFLKAETAEEATMMATAATEKKRSEWQRILLLRALGRCQAKVPAKVLLHRNLSRSSPSLRREWSDVLGRLLEEKRLDLDGVSAPRGGQPSDAIRKAIVDAGFPYAGLEWLGPLSTEELAQLEKSFGRSKSAQDRALAVRVLAGDASGWPLLIRLLPHIFAGEDSPPKSVAMAAILEHQAFSTVPALIDALRAESARELGRFAGDLGATLRQLTGQSFGDDASVWSGWFAEAGEEWMQRALDGDLKPRRAERIERPTVAKLFGLAIDSNHVAFLVDGSGSMSISRMGDLNCAEAAAREVDRFLEGMPKEVRFQVVAVETRPELAFKKLMPASPSNRTKGLKFLQSRAYRSTSALYDALELVQEDPLLDTIVLISDGGSSAGLHQYPGHILDSAARLHRRTGVRIHTVLVTDSKKHEKFMRDLAAATGGRMVVPKD